MKKAASILCMSLVWMFFLGFQPTRALASEAAGDSSTSQAQQDPNDIGFFIRPILPENQVGDKVSYFDLMMTPGQRQALEVEIVNRNSYPIDVSVEAISASTSANGEIDYKTPGVQDESLLLPFTEVAAVRQAVLTVPAEGSISAFVDLAMPQQSFDGTVLGGLVFEKLLPEEDDTSASGSAAQGAVIQNTYSYVLGVKLAESDVAVAPAFALFEIETTLQGGQPAVIHYIRNTQAVIVKDMAVTLTIRREGADGTVASLERTVDMAPNSAMALAVTPLDGELASGRYTSTVDLATETESWTLEEGFEVDEQTARTIRAQTTQPVSGAQAAFPLWAVILIIALAAIAVLFAVLLIVAGHKKRRAEKVQQMARERDRFIHRGQGKQ